MTTPSQHSDRGYAELGRRDQDDANLFGDDQRTPEERQRDYWVSLIEEIDEQARVVVHGQHYVAHLFGSPGFGGAAYRIKWLDRSRPDLVCNLSAQGSIPAQFRDQLPDNAKIAEVRGLRAIGVVEAGLQLARLLDGHRM